MTMAPRDFSDAVLSLSDEALDRARAAVAAHAVLTPLIEDPRDPGVRLKPENLQPLGSFKVRGAASAVGRHVGRPRLCTASAGNFGQGLTWLARRSGATVTCFVPESAPSVKREALERLGAEVVVVSFADWWSRLTDPAADPERPFVHPFADLDVIAGNATLGSEIAAQWPDVQAVIAPFGGGGLALGVALGLRAQGHGARVVACEVATAAALSAARRAGGPVSIERGASFVDGIGSTRVLDAVWPATQALISDVVTVEVEQARACLKGLAQRTGMIVEGAAAVAYAAARELRARTGERTVAILSGRNIAFPLAVDMLAEVDL